MADRIREIKEYRGRSGSYGGVEAGFEIVTYERTIRLVIDDESSCCESWGYFLTEDDTSKFLGATILSIELTDTNRSNRVFGSYVRPEDREESKTYESLDEGDVMFVDIKTDRGTLQFVAYNAHNGYYGHEARVLSIPHNADVLFSKGL